MSAHLLSIFSRLLFGLDSLRLFDCMCVGLCLSGSRRGGFL
jgi:hypothetical protein